MQKQENKPSPLSALSYKLKAVSGFTLVEMLIAISILILVAGIGGLYLNDLYGAKKVQNAAAQINALLLVAQEKSASQEGDSRWGVYFKRPGGGTASYELYKVNEGNIGNPPESDQIVQRVPLPIGVVFKNIASGLSKDIYFKKITGLPVTPDEIQLEDAESANLITIKVEANGRIDVQ